ncbi:hypothetical protein PFISCL1PPCAC_14231, partial [Pristionchus fissidentatus]
KTPDRTSHRTILHTLTIQSMLPSVYITAISLWMLDLIGLVESEILQRTVVMTTSVVALVTPLVNLYYLPPYRKISRCNYAMNNSAKIISLSQLSMLDVEDVLHFALISAMDLSAVFANILLIVAILSRTPKTFAVYAVILLNITLVDLTTSLTSWLCTVRSDIMNIKLAMVMIYVGPCTLLGARWCQAFISLHVAAVDQSIVVLVISFAYRLWILNNILTSVFPNNNLLLALTFSCVFILTIP